MITIDKEAQNNFRLPSDFSNFSVRYKTENDLFIFQSPDMTVIDNNLFFILKYSNQEKFDTYYKYRPAYLSYDRYGTRVYSYLLMYINGIFCEEDFDLDIISIPPIDIITEIFSSNIPKQDLDNLETINW